MDRFSPVAPAHIRVLVLPVGKLERPRFLEFLGRLQNEAAVIKLADVERYVGDNDFLLSPKAFPRGCLLFNYTTSVPSEQQQQLSPYELFRESLLVLGVKDGVDRNEDATEEELETAVEYLRERHPRVVHRHLLILEELETQSNRAIENTTWIGNAGTAKDLSLKEAAAQWSARFLTELTTYTRAMQASPSVQTPGQTARSLQRTISYREQEKRPASGHNTPQNAEPSTPVDENGPKPIPLNQGSPATSFDQITAANSSTSNISRSDSRASNKGKHGARASSQDRVSVQGFGSGTSQEKLKHRGRARVGIVIGSIHMMAGQWAEALRVLVDHTNRSRMLADHLWHAKGLETVVVCMLLHVWAGLEFQIPSICYPMADRASQHVHRFSANLQPSDFASPEAAHQATVRRLSKSLPELLKLVLSLYRSGEGSLELPSVVGAEVSIRFSKLMATLCSTGDELSASLLNRFVWTSNNVGLKTKPKSFEDEANGFSKATIAELLANAQPTGGDNVTVSDQLAILAGTISVYAMLRMERKKAMAIRDLVMRLTAALTQARKLGAAEMGIHPAASLSADSGAQAILAIAEDSGGINQLMAEMARVYGIQLPTSSSGDDELPAPTFFGSDALKLNVMKELTAFCETSPDPYGVLRLNTALLRFFGPNGAVDIEATVKSVNLSKDEQIRLTTAISRAIGVSRQLGLPVIDATYWDPYLVRGVEFANLDPALNVFERSKLKPAAALTDESKPGNPLLYDPNSSRPGTAADNPPPHFLVADEVSKCIVTLQNPYDISVDIQSIHLVTEGVELKTSHRPITLSPMRLQQVSLSVSAFSTGDCKITGCRIKIFGCVEQLFPIFKKPWTPTAPSVLKEAGQDNLETDRAGQKDRAAGPEHGTASTTVIEAQPLLILENSSLLESSLMLLEGEKQDLRLELRNASNTPASVFEIIPSSDVLVLEASVEYLPGAVSSPESSSLAEPVVIEPGATASFRFQVVGKPGISRAQVEFYYSRHSNQPNIAKYARVLPAQIDMTVNAALQVQHLDVLPLGFEQNADNRIVVSFDVGNAWPKSLSYCCSVMELGDSHESEIGRTKQEGTLAPGEVQRIFLPVSRSTTAVHAGDDAETLRKSLLKRLRVTWHGEGRVGEVDMLGLAVSPEALDLVRGSPIHVRLELLGSPEDSTVKAGSFVTLRARIVNSAAEGTPLFVQLQHLPLTSADLAQHDRRFAVAGAQHRILAPVAVGKEAVVDFAVCPLLSGIVELEATARPALQGKDMEWEGVRASASLSLMVV